MTSIKIKTTVSNLTKFEPLKYLDSTACRFKGHKPNTEYEQGTSTSSEISSAHSYDTVSCSTKKDNK